MSSSRASEVSTTLTTMREMSSSGRRSQVPPVAFLFGLHGDALWESGREVNTSIDEIGYPS
jgi:hypothetical protein